MEINIRKLVGSVFYTGYIPYAPGTYGSLVALAFYFIPGFRNYYIVFPAIMLLFFIGIPLGNYFEKEYGKDPGIFTLDEVIGTWISLLLFPEELIWILATFTIWRILDIVKPFPVRYVENLNGGLGIMLDDVVSGMYSLIIIYIFNILKN